MSKTSLSEASICADLCHRVERSRKAGPADRPADRVRARVTRPLIDVKAIESEAVAPQCAATLNGIPGILIHGRYGVSTPLDTAWRLAQGWSTRKATDAESSCRTNPRPVSRPGDGQAGADADPRVGHRSVHPDRHRLPLGDLA